MLAVVERAKKKRKLNRPLRDPALDLVLEAIEGRTPKDIAEGGGYIGASTVRNWRAGKCCPLHYTLEAAAGAVGKEFTLIDKIKAGSKRRGR